jgi:uncharacterized protein YecT (DUF1311 family)
MLPTPNHQCLARFCAIAHRWQLIALVFGLFALSAVGQESCPSGEDAGNKLATELSQAKTCQDAAERLESCAWGSSADAQFAPIVIEKCEKSFLPKLSKQAQDRYMEEMQLCAYEFSRQDGTMYISAAALCQVDVAAEIAKDPASSNLPMDRASFDCNRAQTPLETVICSDTKLGHADIVLGRVYANTLNSAPDEVKTALIQDEKQWLKSISEKCGLAARVNSQTSLNCVRNQFERRFTDLDVCANGDNVIACLHVPDNQPSEDDSAPRASFDCEAPSTALEIVICADAELGQADIKLAEAYRLAGSKMAQEQKKHLIESERQWLHFVNKTCPLGAVGGIPPIMTRSCVRTAFETRISQLAACPQKKTEEQLPCLNDFHLFEKKDAP